MECISSSISMVIHSKFANSHQSQTMTDLIKTALLPHDCTLMAHKSSDLQTMLNRYLDDSKQFDLTISLERTEGLFQPAPNSSATQPTITINSLELKSVKSFKYLGSTILSDRQLNKEIFERISKPSQALGRLHKRVLSHHNMSLNKKLKVYKAVVLTSLLYGCKSWTS